MDSFDAVFSLHPSLPLDTQTPVKRLELDLADHPVDGGEPIFNDYICVIA